MVDSKKKLEDFLESTRTTLRNTSKDKINHMEMSTSNKDVYDFDKLKETYVNEKCLNLYQGQEATTPCSVDALFSLENKDKTSYVMVEFKNGKFNQYEIQKKIYDSVTIFSDLTNRSISDFRENDIFILVYNENKKSGIPQKFKTYDVENDVKVNDMSSRDFIGRRISELANKPFIKFNLEMFRGYLFKRVYTLTKCEFQKFLDRKQIS